MSESKYRVALLGAKQLIPSAAPCRSDISCRGFVEANARCFWSAALLEAMRELSFEGYVSPGVLLVRAGACALDVVRAAWARRVLKPPPNYLIEDVGEYASSSGRPGENVRAGGAGSRRAGRS
ncbi:Storkhead-box protein 1 [Frankliniella fusca]|uniref:Storkhead-box protein 1 n=1 Tax=Frankliniella fusca TaxID=407009 RepID=A0AAE1I2N3_9NEOP|nr:Storkhead-box protein 1 [Frankliniella fusca]